MPLFQPVVSVKSQPESAPYASYTACLSCIAMGVCVGGDPHDEHDSWRGDRQALCDIPQ